MFPISYWWGPPKQFNTRERYQEVADAGFTYAMHGPEGGGTPEENKLTLDHCQAVGIKAFLYDSRMPHAIGGDAGVKREHRRDRGRLCEASGVRRLLHRR